MEQAWTALPENPWDARFEQVDEYPETEAQYLAPNGAPTLSSRAWHHLLIGLNSDASGWFPWMPRTRHRTTVLDTSRAFSTELLDRFARQVAARLGKPSSACKDYVLALNPGPARTAELSLDVERPLSLVAADGSRIDGAVISRNGKWTASARVDLPGYGYRLLGLAEQGPAQPVAWRTGSEVSSADRHAGLSEGRLTVIEGQTQVTVAVAPFRLQDPSGVAPAADVAPTWSGAATRVRETVFGPELEVFTELAFAVWLRLVIGLRPDRVEVAAEVHVDMPRRFGKLGYDPAGLLLEFRGKSGRAFYDVPYATIEHTNPKPSFVAVQRFAALDAGADSFAVVALGGNQSFRLAPEDGVLAAGLGSSVQGRADTRPECVILENGYARHTITSNGDPFLGSSEHRFALLFRRPAAAAKAAHLLRTGVPVFPVSPAGGDWPEQQSLLHLDAPAARATAFRTVNGISSVVLNDLGGEPSTIRCGNESRSIPAFGICTMTVKA